MRLHLNRNGLCPTIAGASVPLGLLRSFSLPAMALLLAGVALPFFGEIVGLLTISVLIAYLCYPIHIVPIAGFLLTGVLIGPSALGGAVGSSLARLH